ncbi:hypothetical protein POV26_01620 [Aequorivita todarodis]|uniref:hypothetical protein n=1 Tax=Aequorivita todarodis TaxID=2036821 RepID=UPI00235039B4|nr:hypothetical protein [Aequorivita todarodis]MDC7999724.1 hypothetical protein [Aequorivita todarodis]
MNTRKFKPGDWVKIKGNDDIPKMEILKYVSKEDPLTGVVNNDSIVECVYYKNGERFTQTIHQNRLVKMLKTGGIYKA